MAESEVIRRREMRRRKILECSEARLKRITSSKKTQVFSEDGDAQLFTNEDAQKKHFVDKEFSDIDSISKTNEFSDCDLSSAMYNVNTNESLCNKDSSDKSRTKLSGGGGGDVVSTVSANGAAQRSYATDYYAFPKKVSDAETRSFGRTRCDARRNSTCTQMMMETLQISSFSLSLLRPWLIVVLAFLVKAYFLVTKKLPFFETIFFPYLILELAFYSWTKFETQVCIRPVASSLVSGILLLCGFPASAVSTFSTIFNLVQCAIQDLSVYIFSFVFLHFICEAYM